MVVSKILMSESQFQNFNHLKIHSQYSICEGAVKIDDLKDFSKLNKINPWVFVTQPTFVVL